MKKLRWGYTTGTCAAAASLAAAAMLFDKKPRESVSLVTPKGICLELKIEEVIRGEETVSCAVRKDAGDDPDVTDGILVAASVGKESSVSFGQEPYIYEEDGLLLKLYGGKGVGRVTKPGLSCEVGKAAINPVPRAMVFEQVASVCRRYGYKGELVIELWIPQGEERAEKTFNSRMGILGGISILGTSGMVEPMSEEALLETIRLELRQKHLEGADQVILTPGNYGEAFLSKTLGVNLDQAVKCSNFIGDTIDMAAEEGIKSLLLVGHGGKLIKTAAGIMNTHSSMADGRMEILAAYGAAYGAPSDLVCRVLEAVTVDQALALLETREGLRERVMARVIENAAFHIRRRAGDGLKVQILMFTNERGILGMTEGAEEMLDFFRSCKNILPLALPVK